MPRRSHRQHRTRFCAWALVFASSVACDSSTETEVRVPAAVMILAGNEQEGTVGVELPDPLVARVVDDDGNPVAGQLVNFRVVSGGGTMFAGSGLTNADGVVQDRWTLGTSTSEAQRVEARAVDPATGTPIVFETFTAIPLPGPPAALAKHVGDEQVGTAGAPVPVPPAVRVADVYDNPVPGVTVTFEAETEGASVAGATAVTDAAGIASVERWTLGPQVGEYALTAHVASLPAVRFTATARVGAAQSLRKVEGDGQVAGAGTAVAIVPRVIVEDPNGNPMPAGGATVTFSVTTGGGSVAAASATTDANGAATPGQWTLGTVAGPQALSASLPGGATVTFEATAVPRDTLITKLAGDEQVAHPTEMLPEAIVVRVADRYGNPVAGQVVSWLAVESGSSVQPENPQACAPPERPCTLAYGITDEQGRASARWTLGSGAFPRIAGNGETETLRASVFRGGAEAPTVTFTASLKLLRATTLVAGERHVCATTGEGTLYCWGDNEAGQLGNGRTGTEGHPVRASAVDREFVALALGGSHTCGLTAEGAVWCWGDNSSGQLGNGTTGGTQLTPTRVIGDHVFRGIAAGERHTCAFTREPQERFPHWTGSIYCWGSNTSGQLGIESTETCTTGPCSSTPLGQTPIIAPFGAAAGSEHTCFILLQSQGSGTTCWGANDHEQLDTPRSTVASSVRAGRNFTCQREAILDSPRCWGENTWGQMGNGTAGHSSPPAIASLPVHQRTQSLSTGLGDHMCIITSENRAYCWGRGTHGQIGTGTTEDVNALPELVTASLSFTHIGTGLTFSCGRVSTGAIFCWGTGAAIGQGTANAQRLYPTPVAAPRD